MILVGVWGGVAAYKACELVRLLVRAGHDVQVVQTPASERFVGPTTFAALSRRPVLTESSDDLFPHLDASREAELLCIAPLTATTLARIAHGEASSVLTASVLAFTGPVVAAPAMNPRMWQAPETQANLALLRERRIEMVGPERGEMAEGEVGAGRMAEPQDIATAVLRRLETGRQLAGLRVLVTAGGTREPLDAVRYIGNRSSGRMGFAVAHEAAALGADVVVVAANVDLPRIEAVRYVDVSTAAELQAACEEGFGSCDVLVMAAAVVDFRPAHVHEGKMKKTGDQDDLEVRLERTPDILAGLAARRRPEQTVVGFAAEHGRGALEYGREKLARKGLDAIVVNDVGQAGIGFDSADNEVTIITADGEHHVPRAAKAEVARAVLAEVGRLRTAGSPA